jgi:hypothetical protein
MGERINEHYNWTNKPKIGYGRYRDAEIARTKLSKDRGVFFDTYSCIVCGNWHIGRTPNPKYGWKEEMMAGRLIQALKDTINRPPTKLTKEK